jgi:CRISPR-associated protein Cas2
MIGGGLRYFLLWAGEDGMFWVVTYDIVDDRCRTRVASELANFGERVQYSVFECHVSLEQIQTLQRRLERLIDAATDRVRYYPLCLTDQERILIDGYGEVSQDWDYIMV